MDYVGSGSEIEVKADATAVRPSMNRNYWRGSQLRLNPALDPLRPVATTLDCTFPIFHGRVTGALLYRTDQEKKSRAAYGEERSCRSSPIIRRVSLSFCGGSWSRGALLPGKRDSGSKCHERLSVVERIHVKLGLSSDISRERGGEERGAPRQFNDLTNSDGLFHY